MGEIKKIGWLAATTAQRLVRASHLPSRITPVQQGSVALIGTGVSIVVGAYSVVAGGVLTMATGIVGLVVPWLWNRTMRKYPALATVDVESSSEPVQDTPPEFDSDDPRCVMVWDHLEKTVDGVHCKYTQTLFRVRVTNQSVTDPLKDVSVTLDRVVGLHARHPELLHGYRLNVANIDLPSVDIEPRQSHYFDVVAHERENSMAYPINDLFFRYAGIVKRSVPTDPGVSFTIGLKVQPKGKVATTRFFRVSIDAETRAKFESVPAPPTTGIEPIFESGPPFEEDNYHDSSLEDGGNIYRIGLRSLDKGVAHVARVEIESMAGEITGGYLDRPLRFKDKPGAVEAHAPHGTGPTVFVEFLFSARFGRKQDRFLYAIPPQYGDEAKPTGPFSLRLRITGGADARYMTIRFLRDVLGFPHPVGYDVE